MTDHLAIVERLYELNNGFDEQGPPAAFRKDEVKKLVSDEQLLLSRLLLTKGEVLSGFQRCRVTCR